MSFPINLAKVSDAETSTHDAIYTTGNLNARFIEPYMLDGEAWADLWALETAGLQIAHGDGLAAYLETLGDDAPAAASQIGRGAETVLGLHADGDIGRLGALLEEHGGDALSEAAQTALLTQGERLERAAFWQRMQALFAAADENHHVRASIDARAGEFRPYHAALKAIVEPICTAHDSIFLYSYDLFAINDEAVLLHLCCSNGNALVLGHTNDELHLPDRGVTARGGADLDRAIRALAAEHDELELATELHMPFDISTYINDYDELYLRFSSRSKA